MIFKIVILLSFFLNFYLDIYAQIFENDACGYTEKENFKPWIGNNDFLSIYLDSLEYNSYEQNFNNSLFRIPVTFWLYQSNDGKLGANIVDVKKFMEEINYFYMVNNSGISFYVNEINEIKKSKKRDLSYMLEAPLVSVFNKKKGSINVHISDVLSVNNIFGPKTYYKGTYNKVLKSIIVIKSNSSTGLSHEVGHYLGLKHPHENYNKGKLKQESVSRTRTKRKFFKKVLNCEVNGDCLADTPAEPQLSEYINHDCEFTGTNLKDKWGDAYIPLTNNIMSYPTHKNCREKFTSGQIAVMLHTVENNKYSKGWKVDSLSEESAKFKFDIYEPDDYHEIATIIIENEVQNHTFHKVYKGNHSKVEDNDNDWFLYSCKIDTLNSFSLTFNRGVYGFSNIDLQIYNNSDELIFEKKEIKENEKVNIESIKNQDFYFKIRKSENDDEFIISDYLITLMSSN